MKKIRFKLTHFNPQLVETSKCHHFQLTNNKEKPRNLNTASKSTKSNSKCIMR